MGQKLRYIIPILAIVVIVVSLYSSSRTNTAIDLLKHYQEPASTHPEISTCIYPPASPGTYATCTTGGGSWIAPSTWTLPPISAVRPVDPTDLALIVITGSTPNEVIYLQGANGDTINHSHTPFTMELDQGNIVNCLPQFTNWTCSKSEWATTQPLDQDTKPLRKSVQ